MVLPHGIVRLVAGARLAGSSNYLTPVGAFWIAIEAE